MIFKQGNCLDVTHGIIVHGCNLQGVMSDGFAAQVKKMYPPCFNVYSNALKNGTASLGKVVWYRHNLDLYVANAITQEFYGREINHIYTSYDALKTCFRSVIGLAKSLKLPVHMPDMIGCGLGGGHRDTVIEIITDTAHKAEFDQDLIAAWKF
jgi:O-acetyl-ADP-ribose deacetylase (regulator of RNase III)